MTANPALTHPALRPMIDRGVGDLIDRPRLIGESVARTVIARVAWEAYQAGRREAIGELLTTEDAAARLGVTERRVRALAKTRGVGWQVSRGTWLFRREDIEILQVRPKPGRPKRETPPS